MHFSHNPPPSPTSNPNKDDARELCSKLLCQLEINQILQREEICDGLDAILARLPDLTLDIPEACDLLGKFIARAITDDCIAPKYLQRHEAPADALSAKALSKAKALLSMPNSVARLEMVKGRGRVCELTTRLGIVCILHFISPFPRNPRSGAGPASTGR